MNHGRTFIILPVSLLLRSDILSRRQVALEPMLVVRAFYPIRENEVRIKL